MLLQEKIEQLQLDVENNQISLEIWQMQLDEQTQEFQALNQKASEKQQQMQGLSTEIAFLNSKNKRIEDALIVLEGE